MSEYYRDELLSIVQNWTGEQLDQYIEVLEERILRTREQIQTLKVLLRKKRNKAKDTGARGGK